MKFETQSFILCILSTEKSYVSLVLKIIKLEKRRRHVKICGKVF